MKDKLCLLEEYMTIYIQLIANGIKPLDAPSFDYFCDTYNSDEYSLVKCNMKESKDLTKEGRIRNIYTHGLSSEDGIAYRLYKSWMGKRYYPNNINGHYTINSMALSNILIKL